MGALNDSLGAWSTQVFAANSSEYLAVVCLNWTSTYGSISHKLIQVAMDHYFNPLHIEVLITSYFGDKMQF